MSRPVPGKCSCGEDRGAGEREGDWEKRASERGGKRARGAGPWRRPAAQVRQRAATARESAAQARETATPAHETAAQAQGTFAPARERAAQAQETFAPAHGTAAQAHNAREGPFRALCRGVGALSGPLRKQRQVEREGREERGGEAGGGRGRLDRHFTIW